MKWFFLPILLLGFSALAQDESVGSNMQASGQPASVESCRTPEGREFEKGKPGYKNCMNRKKINRDQKKMPNFKDANDGMGMGIREGN